MPNIAIKDDFIVDEKAAPAVSAAGKVRMYFDSTSKSYKRSQNGGAYEDFGDVLFAGVAGAQTLTLSSDDTSKYTGFGAVTLESGASSDLTLAAPAGQNAIIKADTLQFFDTSPSLTMTLSASATDVVVKPNATYGFKVDVDTGNDLTLNPEDGLVTYQKAGTKHGDLESRLTNNFEMNAEGVLDLRSKLDVIIMRDAGNGANLRFDIDLGSNATRISSELAGTTFRANGGMNFGASLYEFKNTFAGTTNALLVEPRSGNNEAGYLCHLSASALADTDGSGVAIQMPGVNTSAMKLCRAASTADAADTLIGSADKATGDPGKLGVGLDNGDTLDGGLHLGSNAGGANTGYVTMEELASAPGVAATDRVRLFIEDNGAGKTRLMAQFQSGAAQQLAIEP